MDLKYQELLINNQQKLIKNKYNLLYKNYFLIDSQIKNK